MMKNITLGGHGIASLNRDHPKYNPIYDFRGNVNLYFNYQILSKFRERTSSRPDSWEHKFVEETIGEVRKTIDSLDSGFSVWDVSGRGVRDRGELSLLKAAMFSETNRGEEVKVQ